MVRKFAVVGLLCALFAAAAPLSAQSPRVAFVPPDLVRALMLSEAQVQNLLAWVRASQEELLPKLQALQQTQRELQEALREEPPDEELVGALVVAIRGLERMIERLRAMQREAAPGAIGLSEDQLRQLRFLELSLSLNRAANEARSLNLIVGPGGRFRLDAAPPQGDAQPTAQPTRAELQQKIDALTVEVERLHNLLSRVATRLSVVPN